MSGIFSMPAKIIWGGWPFDISGTLVIGQSLVWDGTQFKPTTPSGGVSSVSNADGTLTVSPTTGAIVASLNLAHANTWTGSQNVAAVALTDASSIATDASLGNVFTVTLGGNRTLANPTNLVAGGTYTWIVTQDATGSRTLAYGSLFKWPGGSTPVLTTAANAVDMISGVYFNSLIYAVQQGNFK